MIGKVQICEQQQTDFSEHPSKTYMRAIFPTEYNFLLPSSFSVYQILIFFLICPHLQ